MSRFATDPHWLIYLPPTMSPSETSSREDYLEYPTEALSYFRKNGVERVICEEKHMGSRAVVVVCRDQAAARKRFGANDGRSGVCYTRTGRPFFFDAAKEAEFIARVQAALTEAGFFDEFQTDWFCLDCELMPWSAKARELLQRQYAPVGAAGVAALGAVVEALVQSPAASGMAEKYRHRLDCLHNYREAYRRYCWPARAKSIPTRQTAGTWKPCTVWQPPTPNSFGPRLFWRLICQASPRFRRRANGGKR